ncbi:DUF167 domain-containing protein [Pseudanabaena biceps]|nr:DUF167 domain-containing protein [Pseudanabaena biceps]
MTTVLTVRLTPGARADAIEGWGEDAAGRPLLRVRVRARPVEGQANAALIALLAGALDLPRSRVTLEAGDQARIKRLRLEGLDAATVRARLGGPGV